MMKSKLFSFLSVSLWAFLALNCISCAHQAPKEVALNIDTQAPSEEQVGSEKTDLGEVVASEESQLQKVENEVQPDEQNKVALNVASNDEVSDLEPKAVEDKEVTNPQVAKLDKDENLTSESQNPTTQLQEEVSSGTREAASEPQIEEVIPRSQAEPTVGVPAKVKSEEKLRPRKTKNTSQATPMKPEVVKEIASVPKPEPKTNALGEEEDSGPQLASVEIATFVENHWLAVIVGASVTMVGLFFMVRRRQNDDSQTI